MSDPLETLRDRVAASRVPFTDRGSRLLVSADDRALTVGIAEYETDWRASPPVPSISFAEPEGGAVPLRASMRPDRLDCRAGPHRVTIAFADPDTLLLAMPDGLEVDLHVRGAPVGPGRLVSVAPSSRHVSSTGRSKGVRRVDDHTTLLRLAPEAGAVALRIASEAGPPVSAAPAAVLAAAEERWRDWFAAVAPAPSSLREAYLHAWWVMGTNLLRLRSDPSREAMVPSKLGYVGVWNWDACFHAVGLRHGDPALAADQLRVVFEAQQPDGMLPDVIWDEGVLARTDDLPEADLARSREQLGGHVEPAGIPITKPPMAGWAAWRVFESGGDHAFLRSAYEPIARTQRWWLAADLDGDGLPDYGHHYSSGLDDSPLWDGGGPLGGVDLVTYLVQQAEHLALIAAEIGAAGEASAWKHQADVLTERLLGLRWDSSEGAFWAHGPNGPVRIRTPFGLLPLATGRLPRRIADRLVLELTDPRRFWTEHPVPTVAVDEPAFDPNQMWRGPVWVNVNYMLVEALRRAGRRELAAELRERTLALVAANGGPFEYYHPHTGAPPPTAVPSFGWSAALFVDLALSDP